MRPAWSRPLQAWDIVSSSEEHFLHAILLGAAVSSAELSPHSSAQMAESFSPQSAIPRSDRTICTPGAVRLFGHRREVHLEVCHAKPWCAIIPLNTGARKSFNNYSLILLVFF